MSNDTLSDMLTRIRNANILNQKLVKIPWTRMNQEICQIFENEGFIEKIECMTTSSCKELVVSLKYDNQTKKPCITNLKPISKPGLRLYSNSKDIPQILGGMGVLIVSTSKGILTDSQARQKKIGGQLLCSIW